MDEGRRRFSIPAGVLRADLEGEMVLLNQDTGQYHAVNVSGAAILGELEQGKTLVSAAASVARRTGVTQDVVLNDATRFIEALLERGLIEHAPG